MPLGPPLDHDPVAVVSARLGPPLDFNPFERPGPDPETTIMGEFGEVGLGILRGAVHATGTAMRGAATASPPIDRYRALLDKLERYGAGEGDFDALLDRYTGHPELRGDPMLRAAMEGRAVTPRPSPAPWPGPAAASKRATSTPNPPTARRRPATIATGPSVACRKL